MDPGYALLGLTVGMLVGMTGVGAGSLITPTLVMTGVPPIIAVGTDLAYAAATKSVGALVHRAQQTLDLRVAGLLVAGSVPAAVLTIAVLAATGGYTRSSLITGFLAVALILTALALLTGRARVVAFASRYEASIAPIRAALTIASGAVLGVLVTITSVGAGALGAVLLVALYPAMPVARVAGVDIAYAVPLTLVAGLGHLWLGNVDFTLVLNLLVGSVPGIIAGSLLAGRVSDALVRRVLALVLLYAGARLGFGSL